MTSSRWQGTACHAKDANQAFRAAHLGLEKVVLELTFMSQLFEDTSIMGHLSLHRKDIQHAPEDVLVTLTPHPDVATSLTDSAKSLWSDDARLCWHPIYAESPRIMRLARQMALTAKYPDMTCEQKQEQNPDTYFAESITTETEFVVTNGHAKILRLPRGTYSYSVRPLPENPEMWEDAAQNEPKLSGDIAWEQKRPRPVIVTW
jgi:hypothetical protein